MIKVFSYEYLNTLTEQAESSIRLRQFCNIHQNYDERCQRLFNAIEPGSYIQPHRHISDPKDEMLVAIRGLMAVVCFNDLGEVINITHIGSEASDYNVAVGLEIPSSVWHTVVVLQPGSILLEIKAGPFDPGQPKDLASWAPAENSTKSKSYLRQLLLKCAINPD